MKDKIKKAIICKDVKTFAVNRKINKTYIPKAGDVAVFRVLEIGKHKAIQGESGNNAYIFPGDYIMAAFGNRYATNQFEGYVPTRYMEEYQILGKGGAIGELTSSHAKLLDIGPTTLKLVGYATKGGKVINTKFLKETRREFKPHKPRKHKTILSVGASMDSGKTTSAAYLCRGLRMAGKKVAFIKMTGTVATKDKHFARDCGAHIAVDFSNMGFPSTYMCDRDELLDIYESLLMKVSTINPDYVVVEIADGLLQRETDMLLNDREFMSTITDIMLSCGDSLSVMNGVDYLERVGFEPFAISGYINVAPLLVREVKDNLSIPVLSLEDLMSKKVIKHVEKPQLKQLSA